MRPSPARTLLLASLAMVAFAANSVLARLALGDDQVGAAAFTAIRIGSGALTLAALIKIRRVSRSSSGVWAEGSWTSAIMMVAYAAGFSLAYLSLGAAVGALVLFAAVQIVIFGASIRAGERPGARVWFGLVLAFVGLAVLAAPGVEAPSAWGVAVMTVAGAAWGGYTLAGRRVSQPLAATTANFVRAVPIMVVLLVPWTFVASDALHVTGAGAGYALLSGAVASGLGYAVWYLVVPALSRVQSGIIQLSPAPLAAIGGLLLLGEPITTRILVASMLILGGVALGVVTRGEESHSPMSSGSMQQSMKGGPRDAGDV